MSEFGFYLGLHPIGALAIVVSTVLLYVSFAGYLGWSGQRLFASPSSFDLAIVTVLGAIVGRAILGRVPTLSGGLLALGTLVLLETATGKVRRWGRRYGERHRAVAVMVAGRPERETMRRHRVDDGALWGALRGAGVRDPEEVAVVVLEHTGSFSVLRSDTPVHPAALSGVRRSQEVFQQLQGAGLAAPGRTT